MIIVKVKKQNVQKSTKFENTINHLEKNQTDVVSCIRIIKNSSKTINWYQNLIKDLEMYAYETSNVLVSKKEEIKCNKIIKQYKND